MKKKIFVIEDDKDILNNIVELLEAEKYEVYSASNGREGIDRLRNIKPDLILCDIMMPHINGFEFYKLVKQDFDAKSIPFIFLTAKTDLSSIREGLSLGADDYITKPFATEELLKTIEVRLTKQVEFNEQFDSLVKNINMYIPHEMRTPLVAIIGFSRLMLTDVETMERNEIKEMTEWILWSAHRLHNRIEKFISYSDLNLSIGESSQKLSIEQQTKMENELLNKMIAGHYFICERASSIKINMEPAILCISEFHIELLLKELMENAVKFSNYNSEIIIDGSIEDSGYLIAIKDCGIGMNKEQIGKIGIFKQFSREVHSQDGNGLGLAIAKRIVAMNKGEISFESEKSKYTLVKVKLPLRS